MGSKDDEQDFAHFCHLTRAQLNLFTLIFGELWAEVTPRVQPCAAGVLVAQLSTSHLGNSLWVGRIGTLGNVGGAVEHLPLGSACGLAGC